MNADQAFLQGWKVFSENLTSCSQASSVNETQDATPIAEEYEEDPSLAIEIPKPPEEMANNIIHGVD